jgi:tetratricopeptide (TPR) repeat protein
MNGKIDRIRVIESAEKHVKAGKLKEAVAEYEKLLGGAPQDFAISNIIGDLHIRLGQNERAADAFRDVAAEYEKRGLYSQALAVFKKVVKIKPDDPENSVKLADLYSLQGFTAEAKKEYVRTAAYLAKAGQPMDAIRVYEKIVRLDKDDLDSRRRLAALYREQGFKDAGAEQLDEIADAMLARDDPEAAEKCFFEARDLSPSHPRTLLGLVEVFKRKGRKQDAIDLLEGALKQDAENPHLLNLLGNFAFEGGNTARAEEVFTEIVRIHPMNVNARIKLGRIHIGKDELDRAFELYEPIINNLIKKQKEEKAVGLLGLILAARKSHLPSLDKLSTIYRANKDFAKLEVVDRVLLEELRRLKLADKALVVLSELTKIRPDDLELFKEYRQSRKDLGFPEEEEEERSEANWAVSGKDREVIQQTLNQADLYIQQGLVRNARRILENLRMKYSDDPQIMQKIAALDEIRSQMSEEEIRLRVEKAQALDTQAREQGMRAAREAEAKGAAKKEESRPSRKEETKTPRPPFPAQILDEEKFSTADIFAETDIIPFLSQDGGEKKYYDLAARAEEEVRLIAAIYSRQAGGGATQFEKELSVIVADFKKGLKEKVLADDLEIHYQLGIAFLEQGLTNEAIEELTIASKDKARAMECYNVISECYKARKDFSEAERWLNKAILMAKEGTEPYFALVYDRALLSEEAKETEKALSLYREIQNWNPVYRGIADKVSSLEKPVA